MGPALLTFENSQAAAAACADEMLRIIAQAREERGLAMVAVSGGSTPRMMFEAMAQRTFDWSGVEFFQVDERCVPPDDPLSNYGMTRQSLLRKIEFDERRFHRIRGELTPEMAAAAYIADIRSAFLLGKAELPVFDIIQRGMGPDAHTASLFPDEPLIEDRTGIAAAVWVPKLQQHRVTLLPGVLEQARHTLCLATGADKADALSLVFRGPRDPLRAPAQLASVETVWYTDKVSASKL